ncbi:MAG: aminoacyl-tRNA hydrolase [Lachnospiraceae bacterium]|nr:aminoacyl-tRNA hydrolase [Lachnospiraceae bacterium]MBO7599592.1 aminoacyl-tRNA hydrolase [Lachnospiraceae bacterium]
MYLIVGLGNPGKEYASTKHNTGFMVIDKIAALSGIDVETVKLNALIGKGVFDGKKVILAKPITFMNSSGDAVRPLYDYFKPDKLIVVYDDITLDVGGIRVRKAGSAGGHNGMKSIIKCLGTQEFERVRVGIGEKPSRMDLADWVLSRFSKEEKERLDDALDLAVDAVKLMLDDKTDEAMNRFNRKVERDTDT